MTRSGERTVEGTIPDPEQLAIEMEWLCGLARSLLCGEDSADDLAQDVSLAALTYPSGAIAFRRGWLASVLRRRAAAAATSARRRRAREESVARSRDPHAPGTDDLCARIEMQRQLAVELLALSQPFREVIALRFFEGLPPRAIAKRLDVPVETVKSRLSRGLKHLRGKLEQRFGGKDAMRQSLAPLVALPAAPGVGVGGFLGSLLWSTILMKKQLVFGAALLTLGVAVFTLWPNTEAGHSALNDAPSITGAVSEGADVAREGPGDRSEVRTDLPSSAGLPATIRPLRVQVVDPAGQPVVGVPVRIHRKRPGTIAGWEVLGTGTTEGAEGIARIETPLCWGDGMNSADVFADIYARIPPSFALRRDAMPAEPVLLVLPETGNVVVRFEHTSGRPLNVRNGVKLHLAGEDSAPSSSVAGSRFFGSFRGWDEVVGNEIRIPFVEVGLDLRVSARPGVLDLGYEKWIENREIAGPAQADATVTCRIESGYPLLRGRLLDAAGATVTRALVQIRLRRQARRSGGTQGGTLRTDSDGVFHIPAGWHARPETNSTGADPVRRDLFFVRRDTPLHALPPLVEGTLGAHVELLEISPVGIHDLGDIRLAPIGTLVHGRVVDRNGKGIEGVRISVRGPANVRDVSADDMHYSVGLAGEHRTDARGGFSILGIALSERIRVVAQKPDWPLASIVVPVGVSTPVTVRMRRGARLFGQLQIAPGVPPTALSLVLRPEGGSPIYARADDEGRFRFTSLPAGSYRFVAALDGSRVADLSGVEIREEADSRDPRLDPLDLRNQIAVTALQLVDTSGNAVVMQSVHVTAVPKRTVGGWGFHGKTDAEGGCSYVRVAQKGEERCRVEVAGFLPRTVVLKETAQRVTMTKTLDLLVRLSEGTPSPESPRFYVAELRRLDPTAGAGATRPWQARGHFYKNRDFTFHLPGPGRYRVTWQVGTMRGVASANGFRFPIHLAVPDIGREEIDVHVTRRLDARLDAGGLDAAFGRLDRQGAELLRKSRSATSGSGEATSRAKKR